MNTTQASRRAFLNGALLSHAGRARELQRQQPQGPPPPWHSGLPLYKLCPHCQSPCIEACEPGIIRLHESDHPLAGIPYLDFTNTGCTFCAACVEACPVEIGTIAPSTSRPGLGTVQLDRTTCLAWNGVICQSCIGRCDNHAFRADPHRKIHVDADACTGCGMCVSACPVHALAVDWSATTAQTMPG